MKFIKQHLHNSPGAIPAILILIFISVSCGKFDPDLGASILLMNQLGYLGPSPSSNEILITETDDSTTVVEDGETDSYLITIGKAPEENVRVDLATSGAISVSPSFVEFQAGQADVGYRITVTADSDMVFSSNTEISHSVSTNDSAYSTVSVDAVNVSIVNDEQRLFFASSSGKIGAMLGVAGADALCNSQKPAGATAVKAVITDDLTRVACTTANCSGGGITENMDWPLLPGTAYLRASDETYVGTTSSAAIFNFPLSASTGGAAYAGAIIPTGLSSDWTSSENDCSGWEASGGGIDGSVGLADVTNSTAINDGTVGQPCDTESFYLLCATTN